MHIETNDDNQFIAHANLGLVLVNLSTFVGLKMFPPKFSSSLPVVYTQPASRAGEACDG